MAQQRRTVRAGPPIRVPYPHHLDRAYGDKDPSTHLSAGARKQRAADAHALEELRGIDAEKDIIYGVRLLNRDAELRVTVALLNGEFIVRWLEMKTSPLETALTKYIPFRVPSGGRAGGNCRRYAV